MADTTTQPNVERNEPASTTQPKQQASAEQQRPIETGRETGTPATTRRTPASRVFGREASPFSLMRRMSEDMDRLFEDFGFGRGTLGLTPFFNQTLGTDLWKPSEITQAAWTPEIETFRHGDKLVVRADLPGLKKDDVTVEVDNDVLTISGERRAEHEEKHDGYFRSERSYGQFYRAIPLPEGVNAESCDATFKDGVLEITFSAPKEKGRNTKKVSIK